MAGEYDLPEQNINPYPQATKWGLWLFVGAVVLGVFMGVQKNK